MKPLLKSQPKEHEAARGGAEQRADLSKRQGFPEELRFSHALGLQGFDSHTRTRLAWLLAISPLSFRASGFRV